jgi:hypothetical protein
MLAQETIKALWTQAARKFSVWKDKVFGTRLLLHIPPQSVLGLPLDAMLVSGSFHENEWSIRFGKMTFRPGTTDLRFESIARSDIIRDTTDTVAFLQGFAANLKQHEDAPNWQFTIDRIEHFRKKGAMFNIQKRGDPLVYGMAEKRPVGKSYQISSGRGGNLAL